MHGCPAAGMAVELWETSADGQSTRLQAFTLNDDGRNPSGLLIAHDALQVGTYRLVFDVAGYFAEKGVALPKPNFSTKSRLTLVSQSPCALPCAAVVSPWSYSHTVAAER
jgi:Transthyretin-like protein